MRGEESYIKMDECLYEDVLLAWWTYVVINNILVSWWIHAVYKGLIETLQLVMVQHMIILFKEGGKIKFKK